MNQRKSSSEYDMNCIRCGKNAIIEVRWRGSDVYEPFCSDCLLGWYDIVKILSSELSEPDKLEAISEVWDY